MHIKETELNNQGKQISTKIHLLTENGLIIDTKTVFEHDEFPDLPFSDYNFVNGFSDDVSFEDAEFIDGEYVVERTGLSHDTGSPYEPYFHTYNRTYFNNKKQKIRIEENGNYENFIQTFFYDDEGYLIQEKVNNQTNGLLPYDENVKYFYIKKYCERLKKSIKLIQYAKYDEQEQVFYSYNNFGDLIVEFNISKRYRNRELIENQYFYTYNENDNWITKKHYENGLLVSTYHREFGDFSEYFKDNEKDKVRDNEYDDDDLLF